MGRGASTYSNASMARGSKVPMAQIMASLRWKALRDGWLANEAACWRVMAVGRLAVRKIKDSEFSGKP